MKHYKPLTALPLLFLLGITWGSGYSIARFAMTNQVPALGYAFWQAIGPALLLTFFCFIRKQNPFRHYQYWLFFLICGTIGIAIPNTNMYFMANKMSAGLLAVLVNTVPLMVYPLALLTRQEQFDPWRLAAIGLGFFGILLIIAPGSVHLLSKWTLVAMLTPFAFALCSIYIGKKQPHGLTTLESASGMLLAAALVLTLIIVRQNAFYPLRPPFNFTQWIVILEIGLSSLGYLLFFKLIRLAGPVFYSLTGGIVALTGLFWGYVLFAETPNPLQSIAIGCIILAIFLISWRQAVMNRETRHAQ